MARWRPPAAKSSPYITSEGEKALQDELRDLWLLRRREVVPAITAAAAEGDRSENAEYIYRKKQLREIDRRVGYLSRRLDEVKVIHEKPPRQDVVFFGAWVTLEDEQGLELTYRIVGADEIDPSQGYISVDSPVARALLGKTVDSEVVVQRPDGEKRFCILEIAYGSKST